MADEITVNLTFQVRNGNNYERIAPGALTFDQAAVGGPAPGYVTIGTSEETPSLAEVGTLGWVVLQNYDGTNYVDWGFSTTVYGGRLEPGELAMFRFKPGTTLYMKANTAACKCSIKAFED